MAGRAMKIAGIVGGTGPESTIDYYRLIIETYRARTNDGSYPRIVINSIEAKGLIDLITAGALDRVADLLAGEIERLARAGANFGLVAANTPHIVFDALRKRSPIPLISIVEATADAARARGLARLALLGTRFTMQGRFYPDVFERVGLAIVLPRPEEQDVIHDIYMGELVHGIFRPESRARISAVIERMVAEEKIDGVILGGTELPLIMRGVEHPTVPFLDTAKIHVERVVDELLA